MIRKINLTDFVILIFLILSGIIIFYGKTKTEHFSMLIGARITAFVIIFMLIKLNTIHKSKIVSFLRHFYPLLFTAYFYGETGYYNNIFFPDLDGLFVEADNFLFGFQLALWFSLKYNSLWFNELMYFSYFSFYLLIIIFPIILYFNKNVANALLGNVENWAKENGMDHIIGPFGFSDKEPQGLLIEGFDEPAIIVTNHNFVYLNPLLIKTKTSLVL